MNLEAQGFCVLRTALPEIMLDLLCDRLFQKNRAGERCLLDEPVVREISVRLKQELISTGHLKPDSVVIQAIAFDKTPDTNWKVAWHQDLMFPFTERVSSPGFDLPVIKQEIHYARPPEMVLNRLLAVRLHLDDCDETNGPLRVSPGSHRSGILKTSEISRHLLKHGETTGLAKKGEVLLMRPLILHASSQATEPKHRRILHLVYDSGEPLAEQWHRAI